MDCKLWHKRLCAGGSLDTGFDFELAECSDMGGHAGLRAGLSANVSRRNFPITLHS